MVPCELKSGHSVLCRYQRFLVGSSATKIGLPKDQFDGTYRYLQVMMFMQVSVIVHGSLPWISFDGFITTFFVLYVILDSLSCILLLVVVPVVSCLLFHMFTICLDKPKSFATCAWLLPFLKTLITTFFFKSSENSLVLGMIKPAYEQNKIKKLGFQDKGWLK